MSTVTITREQSAELFDLRDRLRQAEAREVDAAERHKAAKQATAAAQDAQNEFIDEVESGQTRLFFKQQPDSPDTPDTPISEPVVTIVEEPVVLAWINVPTEELRQYGVTPAAIANMAAHDPPLNTLGDVTTFTVDHELWEVKSIGKAKAVKIIAAINQYIIDEHADVEAQAPAAGRLVWTETEGIHTAPSSVYSAVKDGQPDPYFRIDADEDGYWTVHNSSPELLPDTIPGPFYTLEEAQAACERIDDADYAQAGEDEEI